MSSEITPKTSYDKLISTNPNTLEIRRSVSQDMMQNVFDLLTPHVGEEIVKDIIITSGIKRLNPGVGFAKDSISKIANTVAAVGADMRWDMDRPEMVYMSVFHVLHGLEKRRSFFQDNLQKFEIEERKFMDDEHREKALKHETNELVKLQEYSDLTTRILADYISTNLPQDGKYIAILRSLSYLTDAEMKESGSKRKTVLSHLRDGELDKAYEILEPTAIFKEVNG